MKQWEKFIRHHLDYVDKPEFSADFSLVVADRKEFFSVEFSTGGKRQTTYFSKYAEARDYYEKVIE